MAGLESCHKEAEVWQNMWKKIINPDWGTSIDKILLLFITAFPLSSTVICLPYLYFSSLLKVLCKSHPVEFASYFHYCHSLTFDQRPDYGFLKRLFRELFTREGNGQTCIFNCIASGCSARRIWQLSIFFLGTWNRGQWDSIIFSQSSTASIIDRIVLPLTGYEFDYIFDWTILKYQQGQVSRTHQRVSIFPWFLESFFYWYMSCFSWRTFDLFCFKVHVVCGMCISLMFIFYLA